MKYSATLTAILLMAPGVGAQDVDDKGRKVPDGLAALKHADPAVRYQAAALLVRLGPVGKIAVPELREALKDTNGYVRVKAAEALWTIEKTAPAILLPVLLTALKDMDPQFAPLRPR